MPGDIAKVSIGSQHGETMAQTELREERVDGANLNTAASAFVSQFGCVHMVSPLGNQERQRSKPIEDLHTVPRSGKALQKLLHNEAGGHKLLAGFDGANQFDPFARQGGRIASESQRPDAGIDQEAQRRERSAL
jgi:hypothetical protein